MSSSIPTGFQPVEFNSAYENRIGPIYARKQGKSLRLGLQMAKKHCNSLGIAHGGLLATLADIGLAWGVVLDRGDGMRATTISLNLDYVSSAQVGDWIEVHITPRKSHGSVGFADCEIKNGDKLLLLANGTFKFITLKEQLPGLKLPELQLSD